MTDSTRYQVIEWDQRALYLSQVSGTHKLPGLRRAELEWRPAWKPIRSRSALAFKNERIISYAEKRLRAKLEYTNVVYSLLPARFTMTEMQRVYEAIVGEPMDKRNFRRRVVGLRIVKETGETASRGAHRPAMLYEFSSRAPMNL